MSTYSTISWTTLPDFDRAASLSTRASGTGALAMFGSMVLNGMFFISAFPLWVSALNIVLLPTLGKPTRPVCKAWRLMRASGRPTPGRKPTTAAPLTPAPMTNSALPNVSQPGAHRGEMATASSADRAALPIVSAVAVAWSAKVLCKAPRGATPTKPGEAWKRTAAAAKMASARKVEDERAMATAAGAWCTRVPETCRVDS
mmetsp:Transcript_46390/g.119222  ORF Transcript_46390/g.119222 Transcript_46390/m.119222 type:complete len:201 (-) Transcript_46390:3-605(-)